MLVMIGEMLWRGVVGDDEELDDVDDMILAVRGNPFRRLSLLVWVVKFANGELDVGIE